MNSTVPWDLDQRCEFELGAAHAVYGVVCNGARLDIEDIWTDAVARGRGAARALMQALLAKADQMGVTTRLMALGQDDTVQDDRLERFYRSLGFIEVSRDDGAAIMERPSPPLPDAPHNTRFLAWFQDSKVVDSHGMPKVVYHGTTGTFSDFDVAFAGADGVAYSAPALFVTDDPNLASQYALNKLSRPIADAMRALQRYKNLNYGVYGDEYEALYTAVKAEFRAVKASCGRSEHGEGANVMPLYLSLQNPLDVDACGARFMDVMPKVVSRIKAEGFDGAIVRNVIDPASDTTQYPANVYIAMQPSQLQSAIGKADVFARLASALNTERAKTPTAQQQAEVSTPGTNAPDSASDRARCALQWLSTTRKPIVQHAPR